MEDKMEDKKQIAQLAKTVGSLTDLIIAVAGGVYSIARQLNDMAGPEAVNPDELHVDKPAAQASEPEPEPAPEPEPEPEPEEPNHLPGRSGLFDTKRVRSELTVKFGNRTRPRVFATAKRLGLFLTGVTPAHRLFTIAPHLDSGQEYIDFVWRQVNRIVEQCRPDLGGVEWVAKRTSDGVLLKSGVEEAK